MAMYKIGCVACDGANLDGVVGNECEYIDIPFGPASLSATELADIDAFFVGITDEHKVDDIVCWLRGESHSYLKPVFVLNGEHSLVDSLPENLTSYIAAIKNLIKALPHNHSVSLQHRLCSYLYVDQRRQLQAVQNLTNKKGLTYPLLSLWGNSDSDSVLFWLQQQTTDGLIKPASLVNRTRSCQACDSVMLNYIDTCAACNSINITTEKALHCFTCGNVAKEEVFQRGNKLECPNCLTQLRHIGTDYDRPIENIRCNNCQVFSVASSTRVHCYSCKHDNAIDDLLVNDFYNFDIAIQGIELAQRGIVAKPLANDITKPVGLDHMAWLISWLQGACVAADSAQHILLKITVDNYSELLAENNESGMALYMAAFIQRLSALLGSNNTKARVGDDQLLVLFPYSSAQVLEAFNSQLTALAQESSDSPLDINVSQHKIVSGDVINPSAPSVLAWLQNIVEHKN